MKISKYFTLEEALRSDTAARLGIDNTPNEEQLQNIIYTAKELDKIREEVGSPIIVTSWFRCEELNASTPGSSKTSDHMRGFAVDCKCPSFDSVLDFCKFTNNFLNENNYLFSQIIHEYGVWQHISFAPENKQQLLTIFKNSEPRGKNKYATGLLTKEEHYNAVYRRN